MSEENKEELKEEVKEDVEVKSCDGNCESCEDVCEFKDYDFEPIHRKGSIANIFSIVAKVFALLFFVIGTYEYILSVVTYSSQYGEIPSILEVFFSFMQDVCLTSVIFFAIGEVINLINRIKEAIMY